jgi:hypothetical protein
MSTPWGLTFSHEVKVTFTASSARAAKRIYDIDFFIVNSLLFGSKFAAVQLVTRD